uniref:Uncharacterized protein n=1 Tax=Anopheles albimanus TaxID=7167 RepID=A0A182FTT1_ANOAL
AKQQPTSSGRRIGVWWSDFEAFSLNRDPAAEESLTKFLPERICSYRTVRCSSQALEQSAQERVTELINDGATLSRVRCCVPVCVPHRGPRTAGQGSGAGGSDDDQATGPAAASR